MASFKSKKDKRFNNETKYLHQEMLTVSFLFLNHCRKLSFKNYEERKLSAEKICAEAEQMKLQFQEMSPKLVKLGIGRSCFQRNINLVWLLINTFLEKKKENEYFIKVLAIPLKSFPFI